MVLVVMFEFDIVGPAQPCANVPSVPCDGIDGQAPRLSRQIQKGSRPTVCCANSVKTPGSLRERNEGGWLRMSKFEWMCLRRPI